MKEGRLDWEWGNWLFIVCYFLGHRWGDKDWRGNQICHRCHKYECNDIMC